MFITKTGHAWILTLGFFLAGLSYGNINQCRALEDATRYYLTSVGSAHAKELEKTTCRLLMQVIEEDPDSNLGGVLIEAKQDLEAVYTKIDPALLTLVWQELKALDGDWRILDSSDPAGGFTVLPDGKGLLLLSRVSGTGMLAHERAHMMHIGEVALHLAAKEGLSPSAARRQALNYILTPKGTLESEARAILAELRYSVAEIDVNNFDPYNIVGLANYPAWASLSRSFEIEEMILKNAVTAATPEWNRVVAEMTELRERIAIGVVTRTLRYRKDLGIRLQAKAAYEFFPTLPAAFFTEPGGARVSALIMNTLRRATSSD